MFFASFATCAAAFFSFFVMGPSEGAALAMVKAVDSKKRRGDRARCHKHERTEGSKRKQVLKRLQSLLYSSVTSKSDCVILPLKDETFFSRNNVCHAIHNVALPIYTRFTCAPLRANPLTHISWAAFSKLKAGKEAGFGRVLFFLHGPFFLSLPGRILLKLPNFRTNSRRWRLSGETSWIHGRFAGA